MLDRFTIVPRSVGVGVTSVILGMNWSQPIFVGLILIVGVIPPVSPVILWIPVFVVVTVFLINFYRKERHLLVRVAMAIITVLAIAVSPMLAPMLSKLPRM